MKLYLSKDTNQFVNDPLFPAPITSVSFKRGDAAKVELIFVSSNTPLSATNDKLITFGIKESGKYDGTFVTSASAYTTSGNSYILNPSFNTLNLNSLLSSGDSNALNDVPSIDTMLEVTWSEDSGSSWFSTNTITATIFNDVIKGNEGTPLENPSPSLWLRDSLDGFNDTIWTSDFGGEIYTDGDEAPIYTTGEESAIYTVGPYSNISAGHATSRIGVGTGSPLCPLDIAGDTLAIRTDKTPASAGATGSKGEICKDTNYLYVCVDTNTWKRAALATW
jgi:hypothetical protein